MSIIQINKLSCDMKPRHVLPKRLGAELLNRFFSGAFWGKQLAGGDEEPGLLPRVSLVGLPTRPPGGHDLVPSWAASLGEGAGSGKEGRRLGSPPPIYCDEPLERAATRRLAGTVRVLEASGTEKGAREGPVWASQPGARLVLRI